MTVTNEYKIVIKFNFSLTITRYRNISQETIDKLCDRFFIKYVMYFVILFRKYTEGNKKTSNLKIARSGLISVYLFY